MTLSKNENMTVLKEEIERIKKIVKESLKVDITDDRAFNFLVIYHYFFSEQTIEKVVFEINEVITDGANDGGIDFVYFKEEDSKIILGQCKNVNNINNNDIINELNKMNSTSNNFKTKNYTAYNSALKREYINALDRLPEEDQPDIEYHVFISSDVNLKELDNNISKSSYISSKESITIYQLEDIITQIIENKTGNLLIKEFEIEIDQEDNFLKYDTDDTSGVVVNITSTSLVKMYSLHKDKGIFDLNIRGYVRNKIVDSGIKETLDYDRENFWFFNNGIIIVCSNYEINKDKIKLHYFSIVNGGQTTKLIGDYRGNNKEKFFIQCKIVSKKDTDNMEEFSTKMAYKTNSQKPIYARDLKSNYKEMKYLKTKLAEKQILLEIKRGMKEDKAAYSYHIKNDELGQIILSFVYQRPGSSRSSKKKIFENDTFYNNIYKMDYFSNEDKQNFILDIIQLDQKFENIYDDLKLSSNIQPIEKEILKNGKQIIFALLGILYSLANDYISKEDLLNDVEKIESYNFVYAAIFADTSNENLDKDLKKLMINLLEFLSECYDKELQEQKVTSISNYFKTDKKYRENIIKSLLMDFRRSRGTEILDISHRIFKQKNKY